MISTSKASKQSGLTGSTTGPVTVERRKREHREKERGSRLSSKRKLPSDARIRFGKDFLAKLCELFQSDEPDSCDKLREMHDEVAAYYKEHDLNVMWISDDEADSKEVKAPLSKKMHQDVNKGDMRFMNVPPRPKFEAKEKLKPKSDVKNPSITTSTPTPSSSLLSQFELSDDSDDNNSRNSSGSHFKSYKLCDTCSGATSQPNNMLLECEECGKTLHQKCVRPEITPLQAKDPRFLFVCSDCKDREDEKVGSSHSKSNSSSRKEEKGGMQKCSEERFQPSKAENDILVTFSNFAAKKAKKPVPSSSGAGGGSNVQGGNTGMNKMLSSFGTKDRK